MDTPKVPYEDSTRASSPNVHQANKKTRILRLRFTAPSISRRAASLPRPRPAPKNNKPSRRDEETRGTDNGARITRIFASQHSTRHRHAVVPTNDNGYRCSVFTVGVV